MNDQKPLSFLRSRNTPHRFTPERGESFPLMHNQTGYVGGGEPKAAFSAHILGSMRVRAWKRPYRQQSSGTVTKIGYKNVCTLSSWQRPESVQKKSRPLRRPEFREETPKEAYAASLLHCDNKANQELFNEKGGSDDPPFSFCVTGACQGSRRIVAAPARRFVPKPMMEIPSALHLTNAMG